MRQKSTAFILFMWSLIMLRENEESASKARPINSYIFTYIEGVTVFYNFEQLLSDARQWDVERTRLLDDRRWLPPYSPAAVFPPVYAAPRYVIYRGKLNSTPVTHGHRWDAPADAFAVMVAHRLLSSAMRNNKDNDWPVHSSMLSLHDIIGLRLRRPPSTVPCSWFL